MAWYPYSYKTAFDPISGEKAPEGSVGEVYAVGDTAFTAPLETFDLTGLPVTLAVQGEAGYVPSFQVEDNPSVIWRSGEYVFELTTTMPLPGPEGPRIVSAAEGDGTVSFGLSDGSTVGPVTLPNGPEGPRGPAGFNATGAVEDQQALADYVNETAGVNPFSGALSSTIASETAGKVDKSLVAANVRDKAFGAVGDGMADDTAAINAALATNRDVYLPTGTYRLVAATGFALFNAQNRRSIYGAGIGSTILKLDSGGEGGVIDSTGAELSNLSIDGGFDPETAQANLLSCVQANSNSTVRNVHVYNTRGSCLVGVGSRIKFLNNRLEKFGDHAVYCSGEIDTESPFNVLATSSRVDIIGNTIDDSPTYHNGSAGGPVRGAIKLRNNCTDVNISGNNVAGDQCILINGDTRRAEAVPRRVTVTGNTLLASHTGISLNTAIDSAAGDLGFRLSDVLINGNTINGTDSTNVGVILDRARASIVGNTFYTVDAITNSESGDTGASIIQGNMFRGATGIYKPGTGALIEGNVFDGLTGAYAAHVVYHSIFRGNVFIGCAAALTLRSTSHAINVATIQNNTFTNNTLALDIGEYARSFAILGNIFTGNTTTATVVAGSAFNLNSVDGNRVLSGGAWPAVGSSDSVVLAPAPAIIGLASLPSAVADLRGRMVRVNGGAGVADEVYICRRNAAGAYEWAAVL
jgi:hypothetical protein